MKREQTETIVGAVVFGSFLVSAAVSLHISISGHLKRDRLREEISACEERLRACEERAP